MDRTRRRQTHLLVLATAFRPSLANSSRLEAIEGAGKAGCAPHPRSRAQEMHASGAHEHTGEAEAIRPSLRNGFTAYTRSPWRPRCATIASVMRKHHRQLDASLGASGPHDFTVRGMPSVHAQKHVAALPRPPHPAPNVRDGHDTPLFGARDGGDYTGDLG
jgi:hypothetical protein